MRCIDPDTGNPSDDANCPWFGGYNEISLATGNLALTTDPAFCFPGVSWLIVAKDSQQHYRTLAMGSEENLSASWDIYGTVRNANGSTSPSKFTFASRPACTSQGTAGTGLLIAGRVSSSDSTKNNKLFASAGSVANGTPEAPAPNAKGPDYTVVDNTNVYSSGGNPALAADASGSVLLVTMGMGFAGVPAHPAPRIFAYTTGTSGSKFSARITGPVLPSTVPLSGTPAVDFQTSTGTFHIVVRAPGVLYETYFQNGAFTNAGGAGGSVAFSPIPLSGPFDSDPALVYAGSPNTVASDMETLFFRRGTSIMQTSALLSFSPELGSGGAILPMPPMVDANTGATLVPGGTPAAVGFGPDASPAFMLTRVGATANTATRLVDISASNIQYAP